MASEASDLLSRLDELSKLMALQVRSTIGSQTQTILELDRLGFSARRIGELLGTTRNTANVTVQKAKKRKAAAPKPSEDGGGAHGV